MWAFSIVILLCDDGNGKRIKCYWEGERNCSEVIPMMEAREARVNKLSTLDQCNVGDKLVVNNMNCVAFTANVAMQITLFTTSLSSTLH